MPSVNLTDRFVRSLSVECETEYWDRKEQLVLRVLPSGTKTWIVRYYSPDCSGRRGRYRRKKIGRYPHLSLAKARDLARVVLGNVAAGEDPAAERERAAAARTFESLAEEYIRRHSRPKKRTWREDRRVIRKDLLPALGALPAESIRKRDVLSVLDDIVDRGSPIMANRVRALVSRIFNFGVSRDLVGHNPVLGTEPPARENRGDRVLSRDEIRLFWQALNREDRTVAAGFRLLLLTGQRTQSVLGMEQSQIESDWWTIPTRLFKSRRPHRVYLSAMSRSVIGEAIRLEPRRSLVLASSRTGVSMNPTVFSRAARRIYPELGIERFTPHDLRRTMASQLAEAGVYRFIIERVLGHVDGTVTARYDLYSYDREKKEAMAKWSEIVAGVIR